MKFKIIKNFFKIKLKTSILTIFCCNKIISYEILLRGVKGEELKYFLINLWKKSKNYNINLFLFKPIYSNFQKTLMHKN